MREAEDALHRWLADGPVEVKALEKLAEGANIGWRSLERAKRCLGVKSEKRRGRGNKRGPWIWRLSEDRQPGALAAFSGDGPKSPESVSQSRQPAEDRQTPDWNPWDWDPSNGDLSDW